MPTKKAGAKPTKERAPRENTSSKGIEKFYPIKGEKPPYPYHVKLGAWLGRNIYKGGNYAYKGDTPHRYTGTHWVVLPSEASLQEAADDLLQDVLKRFPRLIADNLDTMICRKNLLLEVTSVNRIYPSTQPYVNFKNGALLLNTGEFVTGDARKNLVPTYALPYNFNASDKCPRFEQFIKEVVPNTEQRNFLLDFIAYSLLAKDAAPKFEGILYLLGAGSNGKSTLLDLITLLLGKDNVSCTSFSNGNIEQLLASIENKLLNLPPESDGPWPAALEKALASRQTMHGKNPFEAMRMIENLPMHIVPKNMELVYLENSYGYTRRRFIIHFPKRFDLGDNADQHLDKKLAKEVTGFMNLLIKRAQKILKAASFIPPLSLMKAQQEAAEDANHAGKFMKYFGLQPGDSYVFKSSKLVPEYRMYVTGALSAKSIGPGLLQQKLVNAKFRVVDEKRRGGFKVYYDLMDMTDADIEEISVHNAMVKKLGLMPANSSVPTLFDNKEEPTNASDETPF